MEYSFPETDADEAAVYEHALGFFDRIIEESGKARPHLAAQA